jgi:hypothetical protein
LKKLKNESQGLFCVTTIAGAPFLPFRCFFTCSTGVTRQQQQQQQQQQQHTMKEMSMKI